MLSIIYKLVPEITNMKIFLEVLLVLEQYMII